MIKAVNILKKIIIIMKIMINKLILKVSQMHKNNKKTKFITDF
jgi:hypothetical protein